MLVTLTHIIPSLRGSLSNPLSRDVWPEFTATSVDDVSVAGVSLTRLAGWCGTPCLHSAAAVVPGTGGMPSPTETASAVVTRVLEVTRSADGSLDVWIDARLSGVPAVVSELRMIGRVSTAPDAPARIHAAGPAAPPDPVTELVSDLRVGDLLTLPCPGTVVLREIDPRRRPFPDAAAVWSPTVCGR